MQGLAGVLGLDEQACKGVGRWGGWGSCVQGWQVCWGSMSRHAREHGGEEARLKSGPHEAVGC